MEKIVGFFQVEDMFDFDNLGFTKTRDNFKVELYLIYIYCSVLCLSIPDAKVIYIVDILFAKGYKKLYYF